MREYEIENAFAVLKEMKRENIYGCRDLFQNLKKVLYSGTDLIYCGAGRSKEPIKAEPIVFQ